MSPRIWGTRCEAGLFRAFFTCGHLTRSISPEGSKRATTSPGCAAAPPPYRARGSRSRARPPASAGQGRSPVGKSRLIALRRTEPRAAPRSLAQRRWQRHPLPAAPAPTPPRPAAARRPREVLTPWRPAAPGTGGAARAASPGRSSPRRASPRRQLRSPVAAVGTLRWAARAAPRRPGGRAAGWQRPSRAERGRPRSTERPPRAGLAWPAAPPGVRRQRLRPPSGRACGGGSACGRVPNNGWAGGRKALAFFRARLAAAEALLAGRCAATERSARLRGGAGRGGRCAQGSAPPLPLAARRAAVHLPEAAERAAAPASGSRRLAAGTGAPRSARPPPAAETRGAAPPSRGGSAPGRHAFFCGERAGIALGRGGPGAASGRGAGGAAAAGPRLLCGGAAGSDPPVGWDRMEGRREGAGGGCGGSERRVRRCPAAASRCLQPPASPPPPHTSAAARFRGGQARPAAVPPPRGWDGSRDGNRDGDGNRGGSGDGSGRGPTAPAARQLLLAAAPARSASILRPGSFK